MFLIIRSVEIPKLCQLIVRSAIFWARLHEPNWWDPQWNQTCLKIHSGYKFHVGSLSVLRKCLHEFGQGEFQSSLDFT